MGLLVAKLLGGPRIEYVPEPPRDWAALWPQTEEVDGSRLVRLLPNTPLYNWEELESVGSSEFVQHDQTRTRMDEESWRRDVALYDWRVFGDR